MAVDATTTRASSGVISAVTKTIGTFVERPVRFELRRYFKAIGLWHDKIDDHEIGLEAAGGFQRLPRIVHCARKVISGVFEKTAAHPPANLELSSTIRTRDLLLVGSNVAFIS